MQNGLIKHIYKICFVLRHLRVCKTSQNFNTGGKKNAELSADFESVEKFQKVPARRMVNKKVNEFMFFILLNKEQTFSAL
jgi:hypothetical protein